jgi:hypothetical protein
VEYEVCSLHDVFYTQWVAGVTYVEAHSGIGNLVPEGVLFGFIAREDADLRGTLFE